MDIAKEVFAKRRVLFDRLADAGFKSCAGNSAFTYSESFMDGDLTAVIKITPDGEVANSVVDTASGEKYLPMNIEAHTGSYVGQAREEYRALLERIAAECFSDVPFISDQANRVATEISAAFGVEPEFPFTVKEKDKGAVQDKDTAVFRHKDTGKWFAIIMTIKCGKLDGFNERQCNNVDGQKTTVSSLNHVNDNTSENDRINVMNVKIYPEQLDDLLKEPGLYRCYHMNKKQWISIALDDEAPDERIVELLKISFSLTRGGSLVKRRGSTRLVGRQVLIKGNALPDGGFALSDTVSSVHGDESVTIYEENGDRRYWLIPSNPATFDVAKGFRDSGNDTLAWHHRINVMPGDIVYIYQTEPVASIMWECEVLESYKPRPAEWGGFAPNAKYSMLLKRLRSFNKGEYPRAWMNEHGVAKTVRGQRSAPDELVQAMTRSSGQ